MACTEHDQRKFSIEKRGLARMSFRRVVISLLQLHCKDSMVRLFLLERTTNSLLGSSRVQRSCLATALPRHVREASTQRLTHPKTKPFGSLEKPNHLNDLVRMQATQMIGISRATTTSREGARRSGHARRTAKERLEMETLHAGARGFRVTQDETLRMQDRSSVNEDFDFACRS